MVKLFEDINNNLVYNCFDSCILLLGWDPLTDLKRLSGVCFSFCVSSGNYTYSFYNMAYNIAVKIITIENYFNRLGSVVLFRSDC